VASGSHHVAGVVLFVVFDVPLRAPVVTWHENAV
jgi:hypothetical protein